MTQSTVTHSAAPSAERSGLIRELAVVLLIGVLPMIVIGATLFPASSEEPPPPFPITGVDPSLRSAIMLATYVVFFLAPAIAIRRSRLPLAHFGITWRDARDFTWGVWGFVANYAAGWLIWLSYWATRFPLGLEAISAYHYVHATSFTDMVSTWPWYVLVVMAEELMARCYLITRIREITGSSTVAIVASSALFAAWHTFWGAAGVLHIFKAGVIFGWLFEKRRSVAAPALAHFIFDALTLLPR